MLKRNENTQFRPDNRAISLLRLLFLKPLFHYDGLPKTPRVFLALLLKFGQAILKQNPDHLPQHAALTLGLLLDLGQQGRRGREPTAGQLRGATRAGFLLLRSANIVDHVDRKTGVMFGRYRLERRKQHP